MGGTVKQVISTHPKEVNNESYGSRGEVKEILIGRISLPIDGGPPRFSAIPERSRTMPFPRTRGNTDASIIPTRDIQVVPSSINRRRYTYGDKVIVENCAFNHISRRLKNLWMGPITVDSRMI